jgi:hypothetical protein
MTFEQCQLFRKTAHLMGHPMMALALSLQFELSLRQKDVIGEWVEGGVSGIVDGPDREVRRVIYRPRRAMSWQWGLTWSHIDENMILRKPTSKSNGELVSEHDLKRQPEVLAEMQHVPRDRRVGPMIINQSTGLPFKKREFSRLFRRIAVAAGLPKDLWNMDARAGAVTEAHEAGADLHDTMRMATHTEVQTNLIYSRSGVEQTSRVADLRMEFRKRANKTGTDGSNA